MTEKPANAIEYLDAYLAACLPHDTKRALAYFHLGNAHDALGRDFDACHETYMKGLEIALELNDAGVQLQLLENMEYLALKHQRRNLALEYRQKIEALQSSRDNEHSNSDGDESIKNENHENGVEEMEIDSPLPAPLRPLVYNDTGMNSSPPASPLNPKRYASCCSFDAHII